MNEIELNKLLDETRKKIGSRKMSDTELDNLLDEVMGIKEYNHIKERIDIKTLKPCNIISMLNSIEDPFFNSIILQFNIDVKNVDTHAITQDFYKALEYKNSISITTCLHDDMYTKKNDVTFSIIATWDKITDVEEQDIIDDILQAFAPYEPYKEIDILKQDTNPISKRILNTSKVFNDIRFNSRWNSIRENRECTFDVNNVHQPKQQVYLTIQSDDKNLDECFLNPLDRKVYDVFSTMWANNNKQIIATHIAAEVFNTIPARVTKKQNEEIKEIAIKMRNQIITIDFSEQMQNNERYFQDEKIEGYYKNTILLNFDFDKIKTKNGRIVEGYVLNKEPVLFLYARTTNQFTCIPTKVNNALIGVISMTNNNIVIERYLNLRIARMKNRKTKSNNHIRYSSIYEQIEIQNKKTLQKVEKSRIRKTVHKILDEWQKIGYIQGYEKYSNNEPYFIGVKIQY